MTVVAVAAALAAIGWVYLLVGHGGYWRTSRRLPSAEPAPGSAPGPATRPVGDVPGSEGIVRWPSIVAVVPARDEADVLPLTLPSLLTQDYPGAFCVVLVDDQSADGTAEVATALAAQPTADSTAGPALGLTAGPAAAAATAARRPGAQPPAELRVVRGAPLPQGWAGKVWAMAQGLRAAGECDFVLFTDADIAWSPGALRTLAIAASDGDYDLVSQMALLRAETRWERLIVPAFVYFFAQLYPFRRASRPGARTAAAAGGCMLVRRSALTAAGGLAAIRSARIDDVALARLVKRSGRGGGCWLGFTEAVQSRRPYPTLASLWDMIARSAYTQLRYSPVLLALVLAGLAWTYALPPAAAIGGLAAAAAGAGPSAGWAAAAGLAGWAMMAGTYLPVLRLYRLAPWRAAALPVTAVLYGVITADSARRHRAGRGGHWKGRTPDPHRSAELRTTTSQPPGPAGGPGACA